MSTTPPPEPPHHESAAEQVRELAHEIQHEIEDAVEHMPPPVRWTLRRIVALVLISLVSLLVVAVVSVILYLANRTEWVAQEVTVVINQTLARRSNVVLEMADLRGNPLTGLRAVRPRVRFRDRKGPPLLEARALTIRYGAWSLATGGGAPIVIELDQPVLRIDRDADGRWRLPSWRAKPARGAARPRTFDVRIVRGLMELPDPYGRIERLDVAARVRTDGGTRVDVQHVSWASGPWGSRLARLDGTVEAADTVRVRIAHLESGDLALRGVVEWKAGERERRAHVEVDRVRWAWLAAVFRNGAFDVPGEGRLVADLRHAGGWSGTLHGAGTWNGLAAEGGGRIQERPPGGWEVEGLEARSAAGDLQGRLSYDHAGWAVSGTVERGDPAGWGALHLTGWPHGKLRGRFIYAVETRRHFSRLDARLAESELAGWRADSAHVRVEVPASGQVSFEVRMLRRGGVARLSGASDSAGWSGRYQVEDYALDEWPDGRATGIRGTLTHGEGTVAGRPAGLFVTGALRGRSTDWLGARVRDWRLDGVDGRLVPTPDLRASAQFADLSFLGVHFDSAAVALGLGDQRVALRDVAAYAGDTLVTLAGETRWDSAGWSARFDRAAMRSSQFGWTAEPPVELAGDPRGVTFQRMTLRDSLARVEMAGRWAAPGGVYDWTATGAGIDLRRLGLPKDLGLGGTAAGDPRWSLDARASGPAFQNHRGDSLELELAGGPSLVSVRSLRFAVAGGVIEARGEVAGMPSAWPDSLTPPRVVEWLRSGERWGLDVGARSMRLDGLGRISTAASGWSGRLSGSARVSGRPDRPEFTLDLTGEPIAYSGYRVDRAEAHAAYRDGTLEVRELRTTTGPTTSTASGHMPIVLALGRKPELPEKPMHWEVQIPRGDLSVVPAFVPQIGAASGGFELAARVEGTPGHPDLDGVLRVRNGLVRMAAREEVLEGVSADFRLDESRLTLDSLTAREGRRGRVRARGAVELSGTALKGYGFDLTLRDFTATETGLYAAEFDADLRVTNGRRVRGVSVPQVTGRVDVDRAAILLDFTKQTENEVLAASAQPLFWTYRIDLLAKDKLKWTPTDADIEFNADLTVEQTLDSLLVYGDLHAIRGTYYFLSTRFKVERADLAFDNAEGGVNPVIDAVATTRITGTSGDIQSTSSNQTHTVTVTITGRAKEPAVVFTSDPDDWDESQILREITVPTGSTAGATAGGSVDSYLTRAINRSLNAELERAFRGYLNDWQLEREKGGLFDPAAGAYIVSVSSQPLRNVNLRYHQRLATGVESQSPQAVEDPFQQKVEAEYRLSRFFYIGSELVRRLQTPSGTTSASGTDFNVKLKARWEY